MTYRNVQALRAVAAWSVLAHHVVDSLKYYIASLDIPGWLFAGGADVFFVLSGFIMAESSAGRALRPGRFLRARVARIVPTYWLLTLAAAAGIALGLRLFASTGVTAEWLIRSLLFLPAFDAAGDGLRPVLFVGWSLNYEMLFYLAFALSLNATGVTRQRLLLAAMLGGLLLAGQVSDNPWLRYYGNVSLLQFGMGVAVWHLVQHVRPPRRMSGGLCALAIACLAVAVLLGLAEHGAAGRVLVGLLAAMLVFLVVTLERDGFAAHNPLVLRQGDTSYSLFLLHPFVLQLVGKIAIVTGLNGSAPGLAVTVGAMLVASPVLAGLFCVLVERPLHQSARRWLGLAGATASGDRPRRVAVYPSPGSGHAAPEGRY